MVTPLFDFIFTSLSLIAFVTGIKAIIRNHREQMALISADQTVAEMTD